MSNLFADLPGDFHDEIIDVLADAGHIRIERIVSLGHASAPGFWYDQEQAEWVVVLRGEARLRFEDEAEPRTMKPGDCVNIAAQRRHRVEWTSPNETTVWLAVFYDEK